MWSDTELAERVAAMHARHARIQARRDAYVLAAQKRELAARKRERLREPGERLGIRRSPRPAKGALSDHTVRVLLTMQPQQRKQTICRIAQRRGVSSEAIYLWMERNAPEWYTRHLQPALRQGGSWVFPISL